MAYDGTWETGFQTDPYIRVIGHANDGTSILNKEIRDPRGGSNYECIHLETVDDVLVQNVAGFDFGKQLVRFRDVNGALITNCRGDAELNTKASFTMAMQIGASQTSGICHNMSFKDILIENVRWGGYELGFANGDGVACEYNCTNLLFEDIEINNCIDGAFDTKSDMVIRNATITGMGPSVPGGPGVGRHDVGIKAWFGSEVILANVTLDNLDQGVQIIGANQDYPDVYPAAIIYYWNVTFGPNIRVNINLQRHKQGVAPTLAASWIPLAEDPYPNGLPTDHPNWYTPTGAPPVPPDPPGEHPLRRRTQLGMMGIPSERPILRVEKPGDHPFYRGTRMGLMGIQREILGTESFAEKTPVGRTMGGSAGPGGLAGHGGLAGPHGGLVG